MRSGYGYGVTGSGSKKPDGGFAQAFAFMMASPEEKQAIRERECTPEVLAAREEEASKPKSEPV